MGCCETRDKSHKGREKGYIDNEIIPADFPESEKIGIPHFSSLNNPKISQIMQEIEALELKADWETVKNDESLTVKKRWGSSYSPEFLVSRLEFDFDYKVPLLSLLEELNNDTKRKRWDKNFSTVKNIEENAPADFIMHTIISVFTFKSEYLEKKCVFYDKNTVYIIVYSIEDDRVPISSITRSETYFGVIAITDHNKRTRMLVYNQTNPNSSVAKMGTSIAIGRLGDWAGHLKKQIHKSMSSNDN